MRGLVLTIAVAMVVTWASPGPARASPSTIIWIPSTDVQPLLTPHLNLDVYARPQKSTLLMLGPTMGVLPFQRLQAEVGFDVMLQGSDTLDRYPLYANAKLGTPFGAWFKGSPALAVGVFNVGTEPGLTTQDVAYGMVGRPLGVLGRVSVGYYFGNEAVLLDGDGRSANRGWLIEWDRTMTEFTDKLWLAVDAQTGESALGAVNLGAAWKFTPAISLLVAYDAYLNHAVAGGNTFTVQLDVDVWSPRKVESAPPGD